MAENMDLSGKIALVTGASRGIGRAVATLFAARGARVAVHYHSRREDGEEVVRSLENGPHALFGADVSDPDGARGLVEEVIREMGTLHLLVNNAGVYEQISVLDAGYDEWRQNWDRTLGVNLVGPANLIFRAAKEMAGGGGGTIVNVSSRGAFRGEPESPAYGAAKAGLNSLGQSMALALAPHGVRVMTVAPGWVDTDMARSYLEGPKGDEIRGQSPLGRVATVEEIAETVAFLASGRAEYATGCIIDVNGASYLRT